jgi:hypothetical protein
VFIVVAIKAQSLPMAPIRWVVVVIVVLVMDRQFTKLFAAKFAAAPGTDPGIYSEGLPPIGLFLRCLVAPRLGNELVPTVGIDWRLLR